MVLLSSACLFQVSVRNCVVYVMQSHIVFSLCSRQKYARIPSVPGRTPSWGPTRALERFAVHPRSFELGKLGVSHPNGGMSSRAVEGAHVGIASI